MVSGEAVSRRGEDLAVGRLESAGGTLGEGVRLNGENTPFLLLLLLFRYTSEVCLKALFLDGLKVSYGFRY